MRPDHARAARDSVKLSRRRRPSPRRPGKVCAPSQLGGRPKTRSITRNFLSGASRTRPETAEKSRRAVNRTRPDKQKVNDPDIRDVSIVSSTGRACLSSVSSLHHRTVFLFSFPEPVKPYGSKCLNARTSTRGSWKASLFHKRNRVVRTRKRRSLAVQ